jgi:hypothetical protein
MHHVNSIRFQSLYTLDVQLGGRAAREAVQQQIIAALPDVSMRYQEDIQRLEQDVQNLRPGIDFKHPDDKARLEKLEQDIPRLKVPEDVQLAYKGTKLFLYTGPGFRNLIDPIITALIAKIRMQFSSFRIVDKMEQAKTPEFDSAAFLALLSPYSGDLIQE